MEIFTLILCVVIIVLAAIILLKLGKISDSGADDKTAELTEQINRISQKLESMSRETLDAQSRQRTEISTSVTNSMARLGDSLRDEQSKQQKMLETRLAQLEQQLDKIRSETLATLEKIRTENTASMDKINAALEKIRTENVASIEKMSVENRSSMDKVNGTLEKIRVENTASMDKMRAENRESFDKINGTVNEKLQKTLDDKISKSFEAVNKRLTEVYEGLGEMKNVASGVTDLKNVLSNVKTRGTMGEIQLGAILTEILAPEQFEEQVAVTPNGRERVDFAVKLPGSVDGESVYLPIDSKFPGDSYANLLAAYDSGDAAAVKSRWSTLEAEIKSCAKSIHDKYIAPPYTTDFAIMFLPFEGLYAEVVNHGMVEQLQNLYKVNIAGPSTMAAMLNSLQMGFRTLAIQKKSGEVWKILEAAKKEFSSFESVLDKTRERLRQADDELDKLIGTRTRAINRKLKDVTVLDSEDEAIKLIEDQ